MQAETGQELFGPGPANALRAGFDAAAGDVIVVVMADLSDDLALVDHMVRALRRATTSSADRATCSAVGRTAAR